MKTKAKDFRFATSADMRTAIADRFGKHSAVFYEVGNGTGSRCSRHADVVAMGLWPSRGLWLEGIEIKVSRSDWLSELRSPEKADAVAKFCDFWWLAVGDPSIVQEGELPERWGLLVLDGTKLRMVKQAPKLEPEPLSREFVAALLRRACDAQDKIRQEALSEGIERGLERAPKVAESDRTDAERELGFLRQSLVEFEEKSGLKIERWGAGRLGEVVAKIQSLRYAGDPIGELERAEHQLETFAKTVRESRMRLAKELKIVLEAEPGKTEVA